MKIWAKTYIDNKITADCLFETETYTSLEDCLQQICEKMDIPTPIVTSTKENYFQQFNVTKFMASDFVESVHFDFFEVEYVKAKDDRKTK